MSVESLFVPDGDRFVPTEHARGPWTPEHVHGGPVAALLAHRVEQVAASADMQFARHTVDLFRRVPVEALDVSVEVVRASRRIQVVAGTVSANGLTLGRSSSLLIRPTPTDSHIAHSAPDIVPPGPDTIAAEVPRAGQPPGYFPTVEFRFVTSRSASEPHIAWTHIPARLLPDVPLTPAVRAAGSADFANYFGNLARDDGTAFINADITLHLHRDPVGEWICMAVASRHSVNGVSIVDAALLDTAGPFGRSTVSSLANGPRRAGDRARGDE
jgi:hypothetical protein